MYLCYIISIISFLRKNLVAELKNNKLIREAIMKQVEKKRHLAKTITWRIIASLDTFLIAWLITGKFDWAGTIAGIEVLTKMFLYYFHERAWYKFTKFGVTRE